MSTPVKTSDTWLGIGMSQNFHARSILTAVTDRDKTVTAHMSNQCFTQEIYLTLEFSRCVL